MVETRTDASYLVSRYLKLPIRDNRCQDLINPRPRVSFHKSHRLLADHKFTIQSNPFIERSSAKFTRPPCRKLQSSRTPTFHLTVGRRSVAHSPIRRVSRPVKLMCRQDLYVVVHDKVYDATKFVDEHPYASPSQSHCFDCLCPYQQSLKS